MINLTDQNFEEVLEKSEKPVLVDFWMFGCPPCFLLSPILEKLAKNMASISPQPLFCLKEENQLRIYRSQTGK